MLTDETKDHLSLSHSNVICLIWLQLKLSSMNVGHDIFWGFCLGVLLCWYALACGPNKAATLLATGAEFYLWPDQLKLGDWQPGAVCWYWFCHQFSHTPQNTQVNLCCYVKETKNGTHQSPDKRCGSCSRPAPGASPVFSPAGRSVWHPLVSGPSWNITHRPC